VSDRTPWWGLVSSVAAPVLLIGGWTVAAGRQRGGFDPVVETISALAAHGADDRWLMTTALAGLGACHVTTALALRSAASPGRVLLALGGVATLLVAAAGAVLLGLVGWFFVELVADTYRVGLSERVAAGAQSLWPLAAALGARRLRR
jgi:hypothetical membrane protein